jgi:hypothetical protein
LAASAFGFACTRTRRPLAAGERHQAHARDLREFLREARVGEVLDLGQRQGAGGKAEREDRRVGRVHLAVDRRRRQVLRQQVRAGVDRRLHPCSATSSGMARSNCSVITEAPPELDESICFRPGIWPELALERRGDRGGHHLGAPRRV